MYFNVFFFRIILVPHVHIDTDDHFSWLRPCLQAPVLDTAMTCCFAALSLSHVHVRASSAAHSILLLPGARRAPAPPDRGRLRCSASQPKSATFCLNSVNTDALLHLAHEPCTITKTSPVQWLVLWSFSQHSQVRSPKAAKPTPNLVPFISFVLIIQMTSL